MNRRQFLINTFKYAGGGALGYAALMRCGISHQEAQAAVKVISRTGRPAPAVGGDCPAETYTFYWDGDHSTSETYACVNSGGGTQDSNGNDGTDRINSSGGESGGQGLYLTANDQYVTWDYDGSTPNLISGDLATIYMRIRVDVTNEDNVGLFEWSTDNDNRVNIVLQGNAQLAGNHNDGTNSQNVTSSSGYTVSNNTWTTVGYSYDVSANTHSCTANGGTNWNEQTETMISLASPGANITLGENAASGVHDRTVSIDHVIIINSYQAAYPL